MQQELEATTARKKAPGAPALFPLIKMRAHEALPLSGSECAFRPQAPCLEFLPVPCGREPANRFYWPPIDVVALTPALLVLSRLGVTRSSTWMVFSAY